MCPPSYIYREGCLPLELRGEYKPFAVLGEFKEGRVLLKREFSREDMHLLPEISKSLDANTIVFDYFKPNDEQYVMNFDNIIVEYGGITSHAFIMAREFGKCVISVKGKFLAGDRIYLENNVLKREEAPYYIPYVNIRTPKNTFLLLYSYKVVAEIAGEKVDIIEPFKHLYAITIKPTHYWKVVKKIDVNTLLKRKDEIWRKLQTTMQKFFFTRIVQECAGSVNPKLLDVFLEIDVKEDKLWWMAVKENKDKDLREVARHESEQVKEIILKYLE